MRTNIDLDDKIVEEAFELSNAKTKKELIHLALEEFIRNRKKLNLMDLYGKIQFTDQYDYKRMREGK